MTRTPTGAGGLLGTPTRVISALGSALGLILLFALAVGAVTVTPRVLRGLGAFALLAVLWVMVDVVRGLW